MEVNKILEWAQEWKMEVNTDKTKTMIISTSPTDRAWDPELLAGNDQIKTVKEYRFLGVTIDSDLRFTKHIENIAEKARKRVNIMRCMSTKDWGFSPESQRKLFMTYVRSVLDYASPSWNAWISETSRGELQKVQNQGLRAINNMCKTCPIDFLHLEAAIEPLADRFEQNDDILWDRYARLQDNDPKNALLQKVITQRARPLKTRPGWRRTTAERMKEMQIIRETTTAALPPWRHLSNLTLDQVVLTRPKSEYELDELKRMTMEKLDELEPDTRIYTDGSTDSQQRNGGAGVFITDENGNVLLEASYPAGKICSSYSGEAIAALRALEWVEENGVQKCTIITDSLSLHNSLESNDWKNNDPWLKQIKSILHRIPTTVIMLWIPSHIDVHGNEKADALANAGTTMDQSEIPVSHKTIRSKIKNRKWEISHERAVQMYGDRRGPRVDIEKKWPRDVRRLFQQLRTGHCKLLKKYRFLIDLEDNATCDQCHEGEETLEHVLCRCPALELNRRRHTEGEVTVDMMVTDPETCRRILKGRFPDLEIKTLSAEGPSSGASQSQDTGSSPRC